MSQDQQRKIAIVTGGSRGIGRSTVESLARRGVNVIFTFHSHSEDADAVVAGARLFGVQVFAFGVGVPPERRAAEAHYRLCGAVAAAIREM